MNEREPGLQRPNVANGLSDLQLLDVKVADTDEADLALILEPGQGAPGLFDRD